MLSSLPSSPLLILIVGRSRHVALYYDAQVRPHLHCPAIIDPESYSPTNIKFLLHTSNKRPVGVIISNGVSEAIKAKVEAIVKELDGEEERLWNGEGEKTGIEREEVMFVCMLVEIKEKMGPVGAVR